MAYRPELVEEMMKTTFDFHKEDLFEKYEPVLYQVIKDPKDLADQESLYETHDRFLDQT